MSRASRLLASLTVFAVFGAACELTAPETPMSTSTSASATSGNGGEGGLQTGGAGGIGGSAGSGGTGGEMLAQVPDFSLIDVNPNAKTAQSPVSPRDYLMRVSAWYFGHAT